MRPIRLVTAVVVGVCALVVAVGAVAGPAALPQQAGTVDLLAQANVQIDGAAAADQAGWSVGGVGDVNGDGVKQLLQALLSNKRTGTAAIVLTAADASGNKTTKKLSVPVKA